MKNKKVLELIAEGQEKEHPILFSTPMVYGLLDNRKRKTRRIVKDTPLEWLEQGFTPEFVADPENNLCPHGKVGDILWVRETFAIEESEGEYRLVIYKATDPDYPGKWKPSIFLKRKDCRILLRVDSLHIERLHDIDEADAIAEGVEFFDRKLVGGELRTFYKDYEHDGFTYSAVESFKTLWSKINGKESWDSNPFVWVISFYRAVGAINSKTSH